MLNCSFAIFQFDDLNVLPATNTGKVGIYKKLNWWGFSALTTAGVDLEVGVMPESSPGMIAFQFPESDRITPTMTISYIKSHIGSFDLKSFHFGCALVTEKFVAGIPKECDVTVMSQRPTARDENATFHFRPTNDLAPMIKAELRSGFSEVQAVTFCESFFSALTANGLEHSCNVS